MRPVTVGYGEDAIGFGINRRKVIDGRAVVRLNPAGPNDRRVKVLRFDDGRSLTPLAVLMHAVCHPCFFTWGDNATPPYPEGFPKMSADFPGEAQSFVEKVYDGQTRTLFLQGCAGDIRPNLPGDPYRCADEADIEWAGRDLGGATVRALARSMIREEQSKRPSVYKIRCVSERVTLPGKDGPVEAELMALKIGPYLLLTMPGEPMVEYGFKLETVDRRPGDPDRHRLRQRQHRLHRHGGRPQVRRLRADPVPPAPGGGSRDPAQRSTASPIAWSATSSNRSRSIRRGRSCGRNRTGYGGFETPRRPHLRGLVGLAWRRHFGSAPADASRVGLRLHGSGHFSRGFPLQDTREPAENGGGGDFLKTGQLAITPSVG